MVSVGVASDATSGPLGLRLSTTPFMATSPVPARDLFPVPVWRPRGGRDAAYAHWARGRKMLVAAFGVTEEELLKGCPVISATSASRSGVSAAAATRSAVRGGQGGVPLDAATYQAVSTAIYWHLLPSLDLTGPHHMRDERFFGLFSPAAAG